jgi:hypothetical protein
MLISLQYSIIFEAMSDGESTSFKLKMRQLRQLLSPRAQPQVISALTYDFVANKEQELTPGSEWFVEVINDLKKSQYADNLQHHVAVAFSKMATTEDYVAVGYQGHVYVHHQDTHSRNIQIPSGHHGPSASHHYFAPNLASNKYTLQAASSSSIGVSNSQQYIAPRSKISMSILDRAHAYAPAHPTQPSYQSSTQKNIPTYLDALARPVAPSYQACTQTSEPPCASHTEEIGQCLNNWVQENVKFDSIEAAREHNGAQMKLKKTRDLGTKFIKHSKCGHNEECTAHASIINKANII